MAAAERARARPQRIVFGRFRKTKPHMQVTAVTLAQMTIHGTESPRSVAPVSIRPVISSSAADDHNGEAIETRAARQQPTPGRCTDRNGPVTVWQPLLLTSGFILDNRFHQESAVRNNYPAGGKRGARRYGSRVRRLSGYRLASVLPRRSIIQPQFSRQQVEKHHACGDTTQSPTILRPKYSDRACLAARAQ
jgi:hypothetical protein